jgi:hypothetical protein
MNAEVWHAIRQAYALIFYGLVERVDGKFWRVYRVDTTTIRIDVSAGVDNL